MFPSNRVCERRRMCRSAETGQNQAVMLRHISAHSADRLLVGVAAESHTPGDIDRARSPVAARLRPNGRDRMAANYDSKRRGPNGLRVLRLPRPSPPPRAATAPAAPSAPAAPAAPAAPSAPRLDPFDILRASRPRRATRAQIEMLAKRWGRR